MVGVHWYLSRDSQNRIGQIELLAQRQKAATNLMLEFEHYRRESGRFRRMSEKDIEATKDRLKDGISQSLSLFDALDPAEEDKTLRQSIAEKTSSFIMTSAKLEPTLFLRDIYYKEEVRQMHDEILADLSRMEESATRRIAAIKPELQKAGRRSVQLLAGMALMVASLMMLLLARQHFSYVRPIARLRERMNDLKNGTTTTDSTHRFRGAHAEIYATMSELSRTVESQRKERHQFLMAVANDLRTPLVTLQVGANMLSVPAEKLDQHKKAQTAELIKRSAYKISKTLDDLKDIANIDSTDIRLDEEIVDLGELIERTVRMLGGASSSHPISYTVPQATLWTLIDPQRFERVIVNLVNKISTVSPQGGKIEISVYRGITGQNRGIEIIVQDSELDPPAGPQNNWATGPETDLLKHWISENGFGMLLAHKILKAHGGTISAAGVTGTKIQFHVRLPEERVANGSFYGSPSATGGILAPSGILERQRVKTMLPDQAVNFGS
jgi:K+-sensing histidine kinase KdpD